MKTKNARSFFGFSALFVCILFSFIIFTTCHNPVIERWWVEQGIPVEIPTIPERAYHIVNFSVEGGAPFVEAQLIAHDEKIAKIPAVTREHYGFAGWFRNLETTRTEDAWDFANETVDRDMILFAGWVPVSYTVTFDAKGGTPIPASQTLIYGTLAKEPPAMTNTGFGFGGWFEDEAFTLLWDFSRPIEKDITLYARWSTTSYTVTFNSNGGSPVAATQVVAFGGRIIEPPFMNRSGHAFGGWFAEERFLNKWDFTTVVDRNLTLHAKWVPIPVSVTFIVPDEVRPIPQAQALLSGSAAQEPSPGTHEDVNAAFGGWFNNPGFTGAPYDFATPVTGNLVLYARWVLTGVNVDFNANGGSPQPPSQRIASGGRAQEPSPMTNDGYGFGGWFDNPIFDGDPYNFATPVTGNLVLYAKWDTIFFTVSFQANGGTPPPVTQLVAQGSSATRPAPMTREGYHFGGWWYENNEWNNEPWNFAIEVPGNMTLQARWEPEQYMVTFNSNIAGDFPDTQLVLHGNTVTRPIPLTHPEENAAFGGWFANPEFTGNAWNFLMDRVFQEMTLYAKWEINPIVYTVTFEADGGTPEPENQRVVKDAKAVEPLPMWKEYASGGSYAFRGWFTKNGTGGDWGELWNFSLVKVTDDITLYARWEISNIRVIFEANGGMPRPNDQFLIIGDKVKEPLAMSQPGHGFSGWYLDTGTRVQWNFNNDIVTSDKLTDNILRLQAVWTTTQAPPIEIVRQVRVHGVYYIDFAGNSITFNGGPAPGAITDLTANQRAANINVINDVWDIMNKNTEFFLQVSGHANPTKPDDPTEIAELQTISEARSNAVIQIFRGQNTVVPPAGRPLVPSSQMINMGFNPKLYGDRDHPNLNRCVEIIIIEILPL